MQSKIKGFQRWMLVPRSLRQIAFDAVHEFHLSKRFGPNRYSRVAIMIWADLEYNEVRFYHKFIAWFLVKLMGFDLDTSCEWWKNDTDDYDEYRKRKQNGEFC